MGLNKELQDKLDFYEQVYYSLDKPIPFKGDLELYPVLVSDYYNFYQCFGCITMDKNTKMVPDGPLGALKKVSNPKGIGQTYLAYLIDCMEDKDNGQLITTQVMQLFELVFHIKKGLYCPHCHKELTYQEALSGLDEYVSNSINNAKEVYEASLKAQEEELGEFIEDRELSKDIIQAITQKAQLEYLYKMQECPECGNNMRDIFSIKDNGNDYKTLMIKDVEINPSEFDELKAIIPRQNILDYDGDVYVDPELKEELELKAKLQNSDYTSPTLEKQLICVAIGTGYSLEYLQSITMRKLSMFLRGVDKKETYYAQLQASMSGMVKFPEGSIKHWIFSDDKHNIKDEMTSLDNFKQKFDKVT